MKSRICFLVVSLFFGVGFSPKNNEANNPPNGKYRGAELITTAQLKDYLTFIASDELEGRDTPSRGLDVAAKFLATNLSRWGVKPAGDNGTYFQRFALLKTTVDSAQTIAEINGQRFKYGSDFLASSFSGAGTASGPLIYAGHGLMIKAKNLDAFAGLDVKDKIVVWTNEFPKGVTFADFSGKQGEDWQSAAKYAALNGAKGGIIIPSYTSLITWEQTKKNQLANGALAVEKFQSNTDPKIPIIVASPRLTGALLQGEKESATKVFNSAVMGEPAAAFEFKPEKRVTFTVAAKAEQVYTQNVVGVVEGSDANLKQEYVAIGAHYDHVGVGAPVNGDAIYNGADDDGSGTVSVLAMAEAYAKGPRPKRSLLFVWHAAEEKGLWGSKYFTEYPTVPIDKIVAQLNIDMIGRAQKAGDSNPSHANLAKPNEVFVVGSKKMSTELGNLSESVNKSYYNLSFNYKYDDPNDPEKIFFRSDHFNYALKGIPIIFYTDGDHEDYHKVTDHVEKVDFENMLKITRTIYAMAWELGNGKRPEIDKKLPAELMHGLF
ncbi:MAG: M20/M25/M40 family metallo-hydrolase [bacterium]